MNPSNNNPSNNNYNPIYGQRIFYTLKNTQNMILKISLETYALFN